MFADEPVAVAPDACRTALSIFAPKELMTPSADMFSPSANTVVTLSLPVVIYFTYKVIGSSVVAATA